MSVVDWGEALEQALRDGAPLDEVLDVADEAIETAAAAGDGALLAWLAEELSAAAAERGGDWHRLAIAAARARALAARGTAPDAPQPSPLPAGPVPAPSPADEQAIVATRLGGEWSRIEVAAREARALAAGGGAMPEAAGNVFIDEERAPAVVYSGWWRRVAAFLIDWVLIGLALQVIASVNVPGLLQLLLPLAYFVGFHAFSDGATLGKRMLGIAVQIADGRPVGLGRALSRVLWTWVLWATVIGGLVDVILAAADDRRQSLHDKLAGTVVIRTSAVRSIDLTL